MKPFTIQTVYAEIARLDPKMEIGSEAFRAAVVMLSAIFVGQDLMALAKFTGVERSDIKKFRLNLRKGGVWANCKVGVEWFCKAEWEGDFWLDVNVALGYAYRSKAA